jgi:hypothetical protein
MVKELGNWLVGSYYSLPNRVEQTKTPSVQSVAILAASSLPADPLCLQPKDTVTTSPVWPTAGPTLQQHDRVALYAGSSLTVAPPSVPTRTNCTCKKPRHTAFLGIASTNTTPPVSLLILATRAATKAVTSSSVTDTPFRATTYARGRSSSSLDGRKWY